MFFLVITNNVTKYLLNSSWVVGFYLSLFILTLLAVAFATLAERKLMASMQRRIGPNVVGFMGLLQPIADGVKLFLKEPIIPQKANSVLFILAPVSSLVLSLLVWFYNPVGTDGYSDTTFTLLYFLAIGALEVYGIIFAGWASNSKYALLGSLRSSAQMVSYEISLSMIYLAVFLLTGTFNIQDIVGHQQKMLFFFPLLPFAFIYLIAMLAETNRAPFDLPEAEAEIVAGYNIEYSGILFAFFFLAEYAHMLFLSLGFVNLFLGGGHPLVVGLKVSCIFFFFVWIRATLPRYRYDQLMELGWKVFLPLTFSYFLLLIIIMYLGNFVPLNSDFILVF